MAILHHKETKIQAVLGRLPKKYTHEQFVEMFIKLYSKDWGKIKSAYIKQSQDKEPGTIIAMPKPDLYLKQLLATFLNSNSNAEIKEEITTEAPTPLVKVSKVTAKKKVESLIPEIKEPKANVKDKAVVEEVSELVKKPKAISKKKVAAEGSTETEVKTKKSKA